MKYFVLFFMILGVSQSCKKEEINIQENSSGSIYANPSSGDHHDPCEMAGYYKCKIFSIDADTSMIIGETLPILLVANTLKAQNSNPYYNQEISGLNRNIRCWEEDIACLTQNPLTMDSVFFNFTPSMIGLNTLNFESTTGGYLTIQVLVNKKPLEDFISK